MSRSVKIPVSRPAASTTGKSVSVELATRRQDLRERRRLGDRPRALGPDAAPGRPGAVPARRPRSRPGCAGLSTGVGDLLLVERPPPRERHVQPADQHQGDEQAIRAGHLADHHDRGQRRLRDPGEEPAHADQRERRRARSARSGTAAWRNCPTGPAEHPADEHRRAEHAATAAGADRQARRQRS